MSGKMPTPSNSWKIPWHPVLIFFFLSAGILSVGYVYYAHQAALFHREMEAQLNAIADLKVKQIMAWRQERMHDALLMFDDPIFAQEVLEWLEGKARPGREDEILHRMEGVKQTLYEGVRLLDSQGKVRLAIPNDEREVTPFLKELSFEALSSHKVIFTDLHLDHNKEIKLDLVVPLHFREDGRIIDVGVFLLKIDPHQFLYSSILSWPTLSSTAEIALLKIEGDEIVYLNELRHRKETTLRFRLPLTKDDDPGVKAALGKEEITRGIDYRGVPVLSAARKITNTPWFLIAKIDLSEVSAPLSDRFYMMAFFMFALIASSGLGMAFVWRNRDAHFYRQQYETERERRDLAQRYEYLTKNANDIIIIMDRDLKIVEANDRAISIYGYPREEFFRLHLGDLYPKEHFAAGETTILEMKTQNGLTCETVHQRQDGTTFPVAISSSEMEINGDKLYQLIIRDMSRSKEREKAVLESEEQLRFLSSQLLMVQENERRRISKELHDGLGLSLTVLKFQLSSLSAKVSEEKIGFRTDFQSLLNDLDGVIEDVRRLSWDLSPGALEELGFAAAINNLLEDFSEHYDILWSRDEVDELNDSFSPLAQVNIYRIFQESLANIGRHAQASQITVSIIKHHASVSFAVEDNGQGFAMSEFFDRRGKKKGIGLAAMQERARLAGGDLKIWSNPGAGTKITFIIPMEEDKAHVATVSHPAG